MSVQQIDAVSLQNRLEQEDELFLLDVREVDEYDYAHIEGSKLIPMSEIGQRCGELDKQQQIVVICHHGMRSQQVAEFLDYNGFQDILNLHGGIDAWSCLCDSSVRRY